MQLRHPTFTQTPTTRRRRHRSRRVWGQVQNHRGAAPEWNDVGTTRGAMGLGGLVPLVWTGIHAHPKTAPHLTWRGFRGFGVKEGAMPLL